MKRARAAGLAAAAVGAAAAAAMAAARRQAAAWRAADELTAEELMRLPDGRHSMVATSDGGSLAVFEAGPASGPAMVMAHGWTETSGVWAGVASRLVDGGHRVVLYDQRGHGGSSAGTDEYTISRLGEDLRDLLVAMDLTDATLVGHSMGGMTVMALAADHRDVIGERARALVLVSTAAAHMGRHPRVDALAGRVMAGAGATRLMSGPRGARMTRGAVGAKPQLSHLQATASMWAGTAGPVRAAGLLAISAMDLRSGLGPQPVPVAVLVGSRDRLCPPARAREIVEHIPGAKLVVVPDAGHQLPFEAPDLVVSVIEEAMGAGEAVTGRATSRVEERPVEVGLRDGHLEPHS